MKSQISKAAIIPKPQIPQPIPQNPKSPRTPTPQYPNRAQAKNTRPLAKGELGLSNPYSPRAISPQRVSIDNHSPWPQNPKSPAKPLSLETGYPETATRWVP